MLIIHDGADILLKKLPCALFRIYFFICSSVKYKQSGLTHLLHLNLIEEREKKKVRVAFPPLTTIHIQFSPRTC